MRVCGGRRPRTPAFRYPAPASDEAAVRVSDVLLEMRGITKEFPGVKALKDVTLLRPPGRDPRPRRRERRRQVDPDEGRLRRLPVRHRTRASSSSRARSAASTTSVRASSKGIVIIHQELALIPHLSITENIFLANEQATRGVINWGQSHAQGDRAAQEGRPRRDAGHADQPPRRRQAAARRDRQGAVQERRAADPRRADVLAQRERLPEAAPAAARVPRRRASPAS